MVVACCLLRVACCVRSEFVNGGWCMADNASPSMDGQIDQVTLGHRYVQDVFGVIPKYAWHIDPFGLSASYSQSTTNHHSQLRFGFSKWRQQS